MAEFQSASYLFNQEVSKLIDFVSRMTFLFDMAKFKLK